MKVIKNNKELTLKEAVEDKLCPNAYSYDGQLEKLKCCIDLQSEMIANLVSFVETKLSLTVEDVENLLGYGYEIVK